MRLSKFLALVIVPITFLSCSQKSDEPGSGSEATQQANPSGQVAGSGDLNLGFERRMYTKPWGWAAGGTGWGTPRNSYLAELDTATVHSGRYSFHLKAITGEGFGVGTNTINISRVLGKKIRYNGWIKTNSVDGYAGLWWRVDGPNHKVLAFNNMVDSAIYGTRDWKRYSFELPVDEKAVHINFGVLLVGKGEAWFDDLSIDTNGVHF
jgi:hypothetical protein